MAIDPSLDKIREAETRLRRYFPPTPLVAAPSLSRQGCAAYLKIETGLPTGSFKPRGALCALSARLAHGPVTEVVASSTGNHGAAVAWAAKTLGLRARIFLPANPNPVKRGKIAELGADIVESGGTDLADASIQASEYAERLGVYFLNDATDTDLTAGPATIGLEVLTQLPAVTAIYVPMGDTALIRGFGAAMKQLAPQVKIIGVQAAAAPSYVLSWQQGRAVPTETCETCADGLATRTPEPENVAAIRELVDDVCLVSEEEMISAIGRLYRDENVVAEPAGAAATAAFLKDTAANGKVVILVTGRNLTDEVRQRAGLPTV
jgi:threonine dehydratase